MKLILTQEVTGLGAPGDVVEVAGGYGRNYLVPRKKAMLATEASLNHIEHEKGVALSRKAKQKAAAGDVALKLGAAKVTIGRRVGEQDKLYGSVTAHDVEEALKAKGFDISRRKIQLPDAIKALGEFQVPLKLRPDLVIQLKVAVTADTSA